MPVDPLLHNVPIVDAAGRPTAQFSRLWMQARGVDTAVGDATASLSGLQVGLEDHVAATLNVHGIADTSLLVFDDDPRLFDARNPLPHAASHYAGFDALNLSSIPGTLELAKFAQGSTGQVLLGVTAAAPAYGQVNNSHVAASAAIEWSKLDKTGSSLANLTTRNAADLSSGNLLYARMPTGAGTWAANGALTIATNPFILQGFGGAGSTGFSLRNLVGTERARCTTEEASSTMTLTAMAGFDLRIQATRAGTNTPVLTLKDTTLNVGIRTLDQFGSGVGVVGLANALAQPSSVQTGGVVAWAWAGALKAQGTSGTVTTIAAADPHCPVCSRDFALEYESANPAHPGYLALCAWCVAEVLRDHFGGKGIIAMSAAPRMDEPRGLLLTSIFQNLENAR